MSDEMRTKAMEQAEAISEAFRELSGAIIAHFGEGSMDPVAKEWNRAFRLLLTDEGEWRLATETEKRASALAAENARLREALGRVIGFADAVPSALTTAHAFTHRMAEEARAALNPPTETEATNAQ